MIALLAPGVAVHVVAVGFPEVGGVGVHEADAADPFDGFPGGEVVDDAWKCHPTGVKLTEGIGDEDDL